MNLSYCSFLGKLTVVLAAWGITGPVLAQARPDAGTLLEPQFAPLRPPLQSPPPVVLPSTKPVPASTNEARIVATGFAFSGNHAVSSEMLSTVLAPFVNRPTNLAGLSVAANAVSAYYRSQDYLLTETYLPPQAFPAAGGIVTINVIEARIGQVSVDLEEGLKNVSRSFVEDIVSSQLRQGDAVTGYGLEKPVLLLRDLAGYEAGAVVEPGARQGEVNVRISISAKGPRVIGSIGIDNFGPSAAGALRPSASVNINNPLGRGDALAISGQLSDQKGSSLYRIGYGLPLGPFGARVELTAARLDYALGKQFTALGATGRAEIVSLLFSQPLLRGRANSLYANVNVEQKRLIDETATPVLKSDRRIGSVRAGLSGNVADEFAGGKALNAFALSTTLGKLNLGAADLLLDQGVGGLGTAGDFRKLNLDFQRAQFLSSWSSVYLTVQAQLAAKNLSSSEKIALGGPSGIRGYPVGEGIGDSGAIVSLEYRYQIPSTMLSGQAISLLTFYDYGLIRVNQNDPGFSASARNRVALGSVGVGAIWGRAGNFLIKTYLAWRTSPALPSTGDADRNPRLWLSAQNWF